MIGTETNRMTRCAALAVAAALATVAAPTTADARNWEWGPSGFSQGWSAADRLAYIRDHGIADPGANYWTPWGSGHTESSYWVGGSNTGAQNTFAVNHDINAHYGIPLLGYLDIVTPLLGTNHLEIAATVTSIWNGIVEAVTNVVNSVVEWVTSGWQSDYTSYESTGSYYFDSFDNGFDYDFGGYDSWGGGGGEGCFAAGTPVTMADGTTRPIESVEVGDEVLAYDTKTGTAVAKKVTETFVHTEWKDRVSTVLVNGTIRATANHLFYVNGAWTRADQIEVGDALLHIAPGTKGGEAPERTARGVGVAGMVVGFRASTGEPQLADPAAPIEVTSVEPLAGLDTVYNLEVDELHNYFTGGVLVHNLMIACQ